MVPLWKRVTKISRKILSLTTHHQVYGFKITFKIPMTKFLGPLIFKIIQYSLISFLNQIRNKKSKKSPRKSQPSRSKKANRKSERMSGYNNGSGYNQGTSGNNIISQNDETWNDNECENQDFEETQDYQDFNSFDESSRENDQIYSQTYDDYEEFRLFALRNENYKYL